jgi:hypothetical protein
VQRLFDFARETGNTPPFSLPNRLT